MSLSICKLEVPPATPDVCFDADFVGRLPPAPPPPSLLLHPSFSIPPHPSFLLHPSCTSSSPPAAGVRLPEPHRIRDGAGQRVLPTEEGASHGRLPLRLARCRGHRAGKGEEKGEGECASSRARERWEEVESVVSAGGGQVAIAPFFMASTVGRGGTSSDCPASTVGAIDNVDALCKAA